MKQLFFALLLFTYSNIFSQRKLSLRPYLGLQSGFWYNATKPQKVDTRKNFIDVEGDIGITLEYQINKRFGYNIGVYAGLAATGHGFLLKAGCQQTGFATSWSGATYHRYGVGVDYVVSKKINEKDFDKKKATVVFVVSGGIGINERANEDLNCCTLGGFSSEDACGNYAVGINTYAYKIKEITASIWARPWLKLYKNGREKIAFSLIFNQGLMNCFSEDITYDYNGSIYKFTNKTRGTSLGFNLSFPITLKKWTK